MGFSKRLKMLRGDLTQKEFGARIKSSQSAVQVYEQGGLPKGDVLLRIRDEFNVNIDWLLTGDGPQHPVKPSPQPEAPHHQPEAPHHQPDLHAPQTPIKTYADADDIPSLIHKALDILQSQSISAELLAESIKLHHKHVVKSPDQKMDSPAAPHGLEIKEDSPAETPGPEKKKAPETWKDEEEKQRLASNG